MDDAPRGPSLPVGSSCERLTRIIRGGWCAVLSERERLVWDFYNALANPDGIAWPGAKAVRDCRLPIAMNHFYAARRRLVDMGLLLALDDFAGENGRARVGFRVAMPSGSPEDAARRADIAAAARKKPEAVAGPAASIVPQRDYPNGEVVPVGDYRDAPAKVQNQSPTGTINSPPAGLAIVPVGDTYQCIEQCIDQKDIPAAARPVDAGIADDDAAGAPRRGQGAKRPRRSAKPRVLTDEQLATLKAFTAWYSDVAWPERNDGLEYPFDGSRDAAAFLKLLRWDRVKWNSDAAKAIATTYLDAHPSSLRSELHHRPLWGLALHLGMWAVATQKRLKGRPWPGAPAGKSNHPDDRRRDRAREREYADAGDLPTVDAGRPPRPSHQLQSHRPPPVLCKGWNNQR